MTPDEIRAKAAEIADSWTRDWDIYTNELVKLTGLTLEQVLLWDIACQIRSLGRGSEENIKWVRKHIEEEHGHDDEWKGGL